MSRPIKARIHVMPEPVEIKRKGLSKRTRFEIFKRDLFTCQYCGSTPPDVVLEIDHIIAVVNGGTDDILNLVTSCFACNSGKSDKPLTTVTVTPDARIERMKVDQEIAEAKLALERIRERNQLSAELAEEVRRLWNNSFRHRRDIGYLQEHQSKRWVSSYSIEELQEAFEIVASYDNKIFDSNQALYAYVSGVMKNKRERRENAQE